jgi:Zn-dependent protease
MPAGADVVPVFGTPSLQVPENRTFVVAQWPVPIVVSRGAFVPFGVFALLFAAFSRDSRPSVVLAAAVLGGIGGLVSLIVHELGHISIARRLSEVTPEKVSVMSLGAAAHFEGAYRNGREQARMALGGPEASFAFALSLTLPILLPAPTWLKVGALALALLNVLIGGLSLLPVHPLDGHKFCVGLLWWAFGSEARARRMIRRLGFGLVAVDGSALVLLLAEKPVLGAMVAALAAVAFGQKRFVGPRPRA